MPRTIIAVAALLALAAQGVAAPRKVPADPSDGRVSPFYRWDARLPSSPGVPLRREDLPATHRLPGAASAERILYTSTDGIGGRDRIAVSGALFVPEGKAPAGGWPVVAWGHGTVGVADVCAPSWAGRSWRDIRYLSAWLKAGFAVVASDYQGLGTPGPHPYLATRPEGYSILDAARAAIRLRRDLANRVVLVGQSQGGGAVIAAAGLARNYAPDLSVVATVATGAGEIAARPTGGASSPELDATSAYALYLALSLAAADPAIRAADLLSDRALPVLPQAQSRCIDGVEGDVVSAGLNWGNVLASSAPAVMRRRIDLVAFPTYALPMPVFMGTGGHDIDVDPAQQRLLAQRLCAAGTRVTHRIYPDLDHSGAVNGSLSDSLPFVRRALAGDAGAGTC